MRRNGVARDCINLVLKKVDGQIMREGFSSGLLALEKKYPNLKPMSFKQAAAKYDEDIGC